MSDDDKAAALDAALTGMFKAVEARGVPEHLRRTVDQLETPDALTPSPSPASSPEP